jgi:hypothetical protein
MASSKTKYTGKGDELGYQTANEACLKGCPQISKLLVKFIYTAFDVGDDDVFLVLEACTLNSLV